MSKFQLGDKVTLRKDSEFYDPTGEDEFNPFGKVGTITETERDGPGLNLVVDWQCVSTGSWSQQVTNSYNDHDLDLVTE